MFQDYVRFVRIFILHILENERQEFIIKMEKGTIIEEVLKLIDECKAHEGGLFEKTGKLIREEELKQKIKEMK